MKGYRFVDASCHFVCALCANLSCLGSVVVIICCLTTSLVINYHALLHSHWLHSETGFDSLTLALSRLESSRRDGVHPSWGPPSLQARKLCTSSAGERQNAVAVCFHAENAENKTVLLLHAWLAAACPDGHAARGS